MIEYRSHSSNPDLRPQAILWRPTSYFATKTQRGQDDLDSFTYISYCIGNQIPFELRTYDGHPQQTSTVYLHLDDSQLAEIVKNTKIILEELGLPESSLAWIRGRAFKYGHLERAKEDRLREKEARTLVLKILATQSSHRASTALIKAQTPKFYNFSQIDLKKSDSRPNERKWQQIVGNVVSHKKSGASIFSSKYTKREKDVLSLTHKGINYLKSIGYISD